MDAYTELFPGLSPEVTASHNGEYSKPFSGILRRGLGHGQLVVLSKTSSHLLAPTESPSRQGFTACPEDRSRRRDMSH